GREGGRHRGLVQRGRAGERRALAGSGISGNVQTGPPGKDAGGPVLFRLREGQPMTTTQRLAAALAVTATMLPPPARADVAVGDKITDANIDKVKDLISPGLEWCIKHGFPMTIGETKRVEWPRAYKEATEKYSAQVKLSADGRSMENYDPAQPFAKLDPKDPQFVTKIMFNYDYGYVNGLDDTDLRNFDADTGSIADHGPMTIEHHFLHDHFRRLYWTGRLYVDPKPENTNHKRFHTQQCLSLVREPAPLQ